MQSCHMYKATRSGMMQNHDTVILKLLQCFVWYPVSAKYPICANSTTGTFVVKKMFHLLLFDTDPFMSDAKYFLQQIVCQRYCLVQLFWGYSIHQGKILHINRLNVWRMCFLSTALTFNVLLLQYSTYETQRHRGEYGNNQSPWHGK